MKRVKKKTLCGSVLYQEVYSIGERSNLQASEPREPRFATEEEKRAHRIGISKRNHAKLINANFTHKALYVTLTFDNDHLPADVKTLKKMRANYRRRLVRRYPDARICLYVGEGENTDRFHMHMIVEGIPEKAIVQLWGYGAIVRIEHLRRHNFYDGVDHGEDFTDLANYLFDHWTEKIGGHRWMATKTVKKPEPETKEIKRNYSEVKPPMAPKGFKLVKTQANQYGYILFIYIKETGQERKREHRQRQQLIL